MADTARCTGCPDCPRCEYVPSPAELVAREAQFAAMAETAAKRRPFYEASDAARAALVAALRAEPAPAVRVVPGGLLYEGFIATEVQVAGTTWIVRKDSTEVERAFRAERPRATSVDRSARGWRKAEAASDLAWAKARVEALATWLLAERPWTDAL